MATMSRPDKEDQPFGEGMTDAEVKRILSLPALKVINKEKSSAVTRLEKILKIHARVMRYEPKGIVIREGDYGNSAFFVMSGEVCVAWGLPPVRYLGVDQGSGQHNPEMSRCE